MASRQEFLQQLWKDVINSSMTEDWIDNLIRVAKKDPSLPFAETGIASNRLLELGASRRDLSLIARFACYESVFQNSTCWTIKLNVSERRRSFQVNSKIFSDLAW